MKNLTCVFAYVISMLVLVACNDGEKVGGPIDPKPDTYHPLFSLNVGNRWDYQKTRYDETGKAEGVPSYYYMMIEKDSLIEGVKTALFKNGNGDDYDVGFANKADGLYIWNDDKGIEYKLSLFIRYPIEKGASYNVFGDRTISVAELNKSVTVPAGAFKCVQIKLTYNDSPRYEYFYFAKNIGLIKQEIWSEKQDKSGVYLLRADELISKNF